MLRPSVHLDEKAPGDYEGYIISNLYAIAIHSVSQLSVWAEDP